MPIKDPIARAAYNKAYAAANKAKAYERVKEWRAANPEKWAAQSKRYATNNPEKSIIRTQRWRAKNPERAAEVNRNTRLKNSARVLANKAKYRAAKANRTPTWLNKGHYFEMQCIYEYRNALKNIGLEYEVDHIVPLQGKIVSGLHVPENLQVIPKRVNRLKSNNHAE